MKTLTETADLILSAASRLEKLAEDPNIAPRTAIRFRDRSAAAMNAYKSG
jgi:hypothetical protein